MMKRLLLIGLMALAPVAFGASSVLTAKGILYSIEAGDGTSVLLTRRNDGGKALLVVPATVDDTRDDRAQLEYDRATDRLYVMWVRGGDKTSDVMMSWLDAGGDWSDALVLSSAPGLVRRDELRTALTRADGIRTALIHVASWVRDGENLSGEYSLTAFELGEYVSTSNANFQMLDTHTQGSSEQDDLEVLTPFPALAISPVSDGVDVVYGHEQGTAVTRLHITPRLEPTARIWKPLGKSGGSMPPAHFAANSTAPVKAFFSRDRVVLYTNDKVFRFVVFENNEWSPERAIALDEKLTGDALLNEIRRSIEESLPTPNGVTQ